MTREAGTGEAGAGSLPSMLELGLADGRRADVFLGGDPDGVPVVFHHGTPSDSTTYADWSAVCAARRLRLVCMSRPGYAGSSRQAGRTVAAVAADVAEILDGLGAGTFFTLGWSGGGPHALACAGVLGSRCLGVSVLAGVGPAEMAGIDFVAGMGPENVAEWGAAGSGEPALRAWMEQNAASFRSVTGEALAATFGGLVPAVDRDALTGRFAEDVAATMRRALAPGFDGWIDDDLAFVAPWGFAMERIAAPVTFWQGELDLMVPPSHGRWMSERIAHARLAPAAGHGHLSLVTQYRQEILDDLVTGGA